MISLALFVALFTVGFICTIPFMPSFKRSSYTKPAAFTFSSHAPLKAIQIDNPRQNQIISMDALQCEWASPTQPLRAVTMELEPVVIGFSPLPEVTVDIGIWCD